MHQLSTGLLLYLFRSITAKQIFPHWYHVQVTNLHYKSGDSLKDAIVGKSNQNIMLFDSTGRVYSLPVHGLPSSRGHGEPVTAKLNPPAGAYFEKLFIAGRNRQGIERI